MKILLVIDSFYPNVDGPNAVVVSLAREYIKAGHEATLLVPDYPADRVEFEGLEIVRCKSVPSDEDYRAALPAFDKKVRKLIREGGFDVIHLHSPFTLGRYALRLGKKYNIPVVITVHTKFMDEFKSRLKLGVLCQIMRLYILKCIDGCDKITTVCDGMAETLVQYGSKRVSDISVIRNGTDMPFSGASRAAVKAIRVQYGLENKLAMLFTGRLARVKNVQFSLKALSILKERGCGGFVFLIVGDGEYRAELEKAVKNYNLQDSVFFAGRVTDRGKLAAYYAACDILLFPSEFDNASIVLLEAAANGLPAATVARSSSAEIIEDGVSGFVWEKDENVWAEELEKLIANPALAFRAGEGAAEKVYADWAKIARQYLALYSSLK